MAEFCLDYVNNYFMGKKEKLTEDDVIMCEDFCEGCGEIKDCVIKTKEKEPNSFIKYVMSILKRKNKKSR